MTRHFIVNAIHLVRACHFFKKGRCRTQKRASERFLFLSFTHSWAIACSTLLFLPVSQPAHSQTLNEAIVNQLRSDCFVLNGGMSGTNPNFDNNLNAICTITAIIPSAGTSTGGAAGAAPQTQSVSVENRRKERLKSEKEKRVPTNTGSASVRLGENVSLFISGNIESLDRDRTTFADGYDSNIAGVTVGGDYRVSQAAIAGGSFTYTNINGDFKSGGGFRTNSYGGNIYGSFLPAQGFFLDVIGGFAYKDYSVSRLASYGEIFMPGSIRTFSGAINSQTEGKEITARVILGYERKVQSVTVGPIIGVNYSYTHVNGYTESDGGTAEVFGASGAQGLRLRYGDEDISSLQSTLGIQGNVALSTAVGVFIPHFQANYIHEFMNHQRSIDVQFAEDNRGANATSFGFQTDKPVRDWFDLNLGLHAVFPNGVQPFVNFRAMVGNEQFNNFAGTVGIRMAI